MLEMNDIRTPVPTIYGDWLNKFGETWKKQVSIVKEKFGDAIEEVRMPPEHPLDVPVLYIKRSALIDILRYLKTDPFFEYDFLSDITATDEESDPRFEVVYNLFSTSRFCRIRVKVRVNEGEEPPTAIPLWKGADWAEREVWDMFGIRFAGHPDMRRILMDERWEGHPLRKDYPLRGYQIFPSPEKIHEQLLMEDDDESSKGQ